MAFIKENLNPEEEITDDCVVRAISKVLGDTWEETYIGVVMSGLKHHDLFQKGYVWMDYLTGKGFKKYSIPNTCPDCYSIRDFCADHPRGTYLLGTGSHVVAVIDGDYFDSWDSGEEVPLFYMQRRDNGV